MGWLLRALRSEARAEHYAQGEREFDVFEAQGSIPCAPIFRHFCSIQLIERRGKR